MAQIHNDSDRLRAFAIKLARFGISVDEQLTVLSAAINRLGDSWKDEGYYEFKDEFIKTHQRVKQFIEETREVTPKLERDAKALDKHAQLPLPR